MAKREVHYPAVLRVRLTARCQAALEAEAIDRGATPGEVARQLVERGLDHEVLSPIRRSRIPVRDAELFARGLADLGRLSGNVQRLYTRGGSTDDELVAVKHEIRFIIDILHKALGTRRDELNS